MLIGLKQWLFGPSVQVYVACQMTGRDKFEQVQRAKFVAQVLEDYHIKVISPVLKEKVPETPGKLVNKDEQKVRGFWADDKYIIRRVAHVVLFDRAEDKSFGMEQEMVLNRGVLWKPSVLLLSPGYGCSVAKYEVDGIQYSVHAAAAYIRQRWGSRAQRWTWRLKMLNRSLLPWVVDQIWAWR